MSWLHSALPILGRQLASYASNSERWCFLFFPTPQCAPISLQWNSWKIESASFAVVIALAQCSFPCCQLQQLSIWSECKAHEVKRTHDGIRLGLILYCTQLLTRNAIGGGTFFPAKAQWFLSAPMGYWLCNLASQSQMKSENSALFGVAAFR